MLVGGIPSLTMSTSLTWKGFQYLQSNSKILLYVSIDGETGPFPNTALDCFSLVSHPLPSLVNNCLNLPTGTQGK